MLTFKQIQEQAFATATEKGWHERPLRKACNPDVPWIVDHDRVLAKHALMHTELTEAHECIEGDDLALRIDAETSKPEGASVEIADFIIRVCDTTQALGLSLCVHAMPEHLGGVSSYRPAREIDEAVIDCKQVVALLWLGKVRVLVDKATEAARVNDWRQYAGELATAVLYSASIVVGLGQDINAAIEAKMAYNRTRPHRHGGKQA